jgi:hypothetical protein
LISNYSFEKFIFIDRQNSKDFYQFIYVLSSLTFRFYFNRYTSSIDISDKNRLKIMLLLSEVMIEVQMLSFFPINMNDDFYRTSDLGT